VVRRRARRVLCRVVRTTPLLRQAGPGEPTREEGPQVIGTASMLPLHGAGCIPPHRADGKGAASQALECRIFLVEAVVAA
jgi:hypothetical protein